VKITPLDIQQQQFRVHRLWGGFDIEEVDNFLELVANEFEQLIKENSLLREEDQQKLAQIQELEGEREKIREVLLSVQEITEEMKKNARKEGDLIIEEARQQARKVVDNGQAQALKIEEEISRLKQQKLQFEATMAATIDTHRRLLESSRENSGQAASGETGGA
jgi:cell division initiation protein